MECRDISTRPGSAPKDRINSSVAHACSFSLSCFSYSFLSITELQLSNFYQSSIPCSCSQCPLGKSNPTVGSRVVLVRVFQRNWIDRWIDNGLMWLWRLRSPTIYLLSASWRTRRANGLNSSPCTGGNQCPSSKAVRESKFFLYSICHMCNFIFICVDIWSFVSSLAYSFYESGTGSNFAHHCSAQNVAKYLEQSSH